LPAAASGIGHIYHLRRRLTMIVRGNTPRSLSALGWLVVLAVGLFLLPLAAQAQAPDKKSEERERKIELIQEKLPSGEDVILELGGLVVDIDEESEDDAPSSEDIAKLKKAIAETRARLRELEAKLEKAVSGTGDKKGPKAKRPDVKLQFKELKDLKDLGGAIKLELMDEKGAKQLAEIIQKAIKDRPELKQLEELKKLKDMKIIIDGNVKNLDEMKQQLGNIDVLKETVKKALDAKDTERAKALKAEAEAQRAKAAAERAQAAAQRAEAQVRVKVGEKRKAEDIDARLDRLMKEIQELRREIHQGKDKPAK